MVLEELADIFQLMNGNFSVLIPSTVDTIDLSKPFGNANTLIWGHMSKHGTIQNSSPPTMNDGSMFADNSSLYLNGGGISVAYPAIGAPKCTAPRWRMAVRYRKWHMEHGRSQRCFCELFNHWHECQISSHS